MKCFREINMSFFFSFLLYYSSATKKRMQGVANISIMAMFVMYLLTALFGYLTFYGKSLLPPDSQRSPCSNVVVGKTCTQNSIRILKCCGESQHIVIMSPVRFPMSKCL